VTGAASGITGLSIAGVSVTGQAANLIRLLAGATDLTLPGKLDAAKYYSLPNRLNKLRSVL